MQTRTFGIEIETTIHPRVKHRFFASGDSYDEVPGFPGWTCGGDGSIYPDREYIGIEIRSPILSGPQGLDQVRRIVALLQECQARPNRSTGIHVHVGAQDLDRRQVRSVRRAFIRYEKALLALNGSDAVNRLHNDFAALSPTWSDRDLPGGRYLSLNLSNWYYYQAGSRSFKPTLECRIWQSSVSENRILAAIQFFVALVSRAAAITSRTYTRIEDTEEATRQFIRNHYGAGIRTLDLRITEEPPEPICHAAMEEAHAAVLVGV